MALVCSLNVGTARPLATRAGRSGIDKVPTDGPVTVTAPGPEGGRGGLSGDVICDAVHHGGDDQAVYAYAREDLDDWQDRLGNALRPGTFGENLTTVGLDVTGARLGERWRIGRDVVLQVTTPRIPCATFQTWMGREGWVKEFTRARRPGAYLRVLSGGTVRAGDPVVVEERPDHDVTIGLAFRALTLEPALLPGLLEAADHLVDDLRRRAEAGARGDRAGATP